MLEYLRIRNFALIDALDVEFCSGLNVLTGETGSGKSFLLKGLDFLTGGSLPVDSVRQGEEKLSVEAVFLQDGEELILRRELSSDSGRSRLFINDALGSLDSVRSLKPDLMLHAGQHDQQKLLSPAYQTAVVDSFAGAGESVRVRKEALSELSDIERTINELNAKAQSAGERLDFMRFQLSEIEKVDPKPGEEDELSARRDELKQLGDAADSLDKAMRLLHGPDGDLRREMDDLSRIFAGLSSVGPDFEQLAEGVESFRALLGEIDLALRKSAPSGADENELETIEARLYALSKLKRKLNRSLEDIISLGDELERELSFLDEHGLEIGRLEKKREEAAERLAESVAELNARRRTAANQVAEELTGALTGLGFSEHVAVIPDFEQVEIHPGVIEDKPRFLWAPNPGLTPQPLDRIASGGELSRFLLALVGRAARDNEATLLLDEVDAGIGGLTLNSVAERIRSIADSRQVLLITHWPQLAAYADRHFIVGKEQNEGSTTISCRKLPGADIIHELSRMAGGGERGLALARDLLAARK